MELIGGAPSMEEKLILGHLKNRYGDELNKFLKKDKTKLLDKYYSEERSIKEILEFLTKSDLNKISYKKKSQGGKPLPQFIKIEGINEFLNLTDESWCLYMIILEQRRSVKNKKTSDETLKNVEKLFKMSADTNKTETKKTETKKEVPKKEVPKKEVPKKEAPKKEVPKNTDSDEPRPEYPIKVFSEESSDTSEHEITDNLDFTRIKFPRKTIFHCVDRDKNINYIFCRGLPSEVIKNITESKGVFEGLTSSSYEKCMTTYYSCTNDKIFSEKKIQDFFEKTVTEIQFSFENSEEMKTFVINDFINNEDTNKIFLKKLVNVISKGSKQRLTSKEIFAYADEDDIIPIGFNYDINNLDKNDPKLKLFLSNDCSNPELIDYHFVNEEGQRLIDNKLIKSYDKLFEENMIKGNVIYFRTLESFLEESGCNPGETHTSESVEDSIITKFLYGVVSKYFPMIDSTIYITDFSNSKLKKERIDIQKNNETFLENYNYNSEIIDNVFVTEALKNDDIIPCNRFVISLLQIKQERLEENYINIVKLFCDFSLYDSKKSGIHYEKLSVKNNETYYKFYKPQLAYNSNPEGIISLEKCEKWMRGHYIPNKYGLPDYLYSSDTCLLKIFIPNLSCQKIEDRFITLVIHKDGHLQCIIDSNVSKADINRIIKECNKIIMKINKNKVYSDRNIPLESLDENFLEGNKNTIIGKFNCQIFLSLVDENNKIVPFNVSKFKSLLEDFFTFVRLEREKTTNKEVIHCVYKRVNNYSATDNLETIIAKMKDPDIHPPFSDETIIEEIMKIANISFSAAEDKYRTFIEMHEIRLRDGKRIPDGTETGVKLAFRQSSSDIEVIINSINDYQTFERVIIFLKSLIFIYKKPDLLKKKKIKNVELKDELEDIVEPELPNIKDTIQPTEIEETPPEDLPVQKSDEKPAESSDETSDESSDDGDLFGGGGDEKKGYELRKLREFDSLTYAFPFDKTCINSKNYHKMPIVISREELLRINNSTDEGSGPRSYTNRIPASKTGSYNKSKDHYFICPRYFDLNKRISLDPLLVENEDGTLKPEYADNKFIISRNGKYWEGVPFNKYKTNIINSAKLKHPAVCCGKINQNSKKEKAYTEEQFEQNAIVEEIVDDVIEDNSEGKDFKKNIHHADYISNNIPVSEGKMGYLPVRESELETKKIGELDKFFNQGPRHKLQGLDSVFLRYGVKQNSNSRDTPNIINAVFPTLLMYSKSPDYNADSLYNDLIKFITQNEMSLFNYLALGNSKISRLFKRNSEEIRDDDFRDFIKFLKSSSEQLKPLNIKIDKKILAVNTLEEFYKLRKTNDIYFAFHLFLSRKYYIEYLRSPETKEDRLIIPLLELYNQGIFIKKKKCPESEVREYSRFIVFENIDEEIFIHYQSTYINSNYKNFIFILKSGEYYEPIILINKGDKIRYDKYDNFPRNDIFEKMNLFISEYYKEQKNYDEYDFGLITEYFSSPEKFFVNAYNEISYCITESGFILPYTAPINKNEHENNLVYDLTEFIEKSPSFDDYIENLSKLKLKIQEQKKIPEDKRIASIAKAINNEFLSSYFHFGVSVVDDNIVNIILKNDTYIPIRSVPYTKEYSKRFRNLSDYDLYMIDNTIQNNFIHNDDEHYAEAKSNIDEYYSEKEETTKLFKKFYFQLFEQNEIIHYNIADTSNLRKNNSYKFIVEDSDKKIIRVIQKNENNFIDYDFFCNVKNLNASSVDLEILLVDKIKYLLKGPEIVEHKRVKLYDLLKKELSVRGKLHTKILFKFIDLIIINKDNVECLYENLEDPVNLNILQSCIKPDELFFNRTQFINGYLDNFFTKTSRFFNNHDEELEIKPIVSLLKIIPSYIKNFFSNSELLYSEGTDLEFLAYILRELGTTTDDISQILIDYYKLKLDDKNVKKQKNIDKIKKYKDIETIQSFIDSIKSREFKLTPNEFNILHKSLQIGIIYIHEVNNKYRAEIFPKKESDKEKYKYLVLYEHQETFNAKLGGIKLADNFLNSYETINRLSKGKI